MAPMMAWAAALAQRFGPNRPFAQPPLTPGVPADGNAPSGLLVSRRPVGGVYGGFASSVVAPSPGRPGGVVYRRRASRVVFAGIAGLAAAPIVVQAAVVGGNVAHRPPQQRPRAITAHVAGQPASAAAGQPGSQPGGVVIRRQPSGVVWGGVLSSRVAVTPPNGSPPGGVVYRRTHARAVTRSVTGRAFPAGHQPGGLVSRRRPARAVTASILGRAFPTGHSPGGVVYRRKSARAVVASILGHAFPAGHQPNGTIHRRSAARAVVASALGRAFPAGSPPGGLVKRHTPARGLWAGPAIRTAVPPSPVAGSPPGGTVRRRTTARAVIARVLAPFPPPAGSQPHGLVAHRAHRRAVTAHAYGSPAVPRVAVAAPKERPFIPRRYPFRAVWKGTSAAGNISPFPPPPTLPPGAWEVQAAGPNAAVWAVSDAIAGRWEAASQAGQWSASNAIDARWVVTGTGPNGVTVTIKRA